MASGTRKYATGETTDALDEVEASLQRLEKGLRENG